MASQQNAPPSRPDKARRHWLPQWRVFTWIILAFNLIMLIWVITGASTGKSCKGLTGDALTNCQAGNVGTGIGVGLIILLWALGDVILGVVWLITRPHKRYCPACGNRVRKGVMRCSGCGFDFAQMSRPPTPPGAGGWQRS
jgi:hypothetical protein